jgi:hypothetical protein
LILLVNDWSSLFCAIQHSCSLASLPFRFLYVHALCVPIAHSHVQPWIVCLSVAHPLIRNQCVYQVGVIILFFIPQHGLLLLIDMDPLVLGVVFLLHAFVGITGVDYVVCHRCIDCSRRLFVDCVHFVGHLLIQSTALQLLPHHRSCSGPAVNCTPTRLLLL